MVVAGASGVVGLAALEAFSAAGGWDVVGVARRPPQVDGAVTVALDLTDEAACRGFADAHGDTTHVVYAALFEKTGLVPGWHEADQMQRNLMMLRNLLDPLASSAGLEHVSLLQGTKAYGVHLHPVAVPARERWPRDPHENFYWLQEDHVRELQRSGSWACTVFRPQVVMGGALGSNMNPIAALGAYGALLREAGEPLHFPAQPWQFVFEAVDADLLARALLWAATAPTARNETFNVTNGDVMTWPNVWPTIAAALGMAPGDVRPISFEAEQAAWQASWAALVDRHGLAAPASLEAFVGQSLTYLDFLMAVGADAPPPPALVSTVKLRQAGFGDCADTEDMFRRWVGRLQQERLLPAP
ncbi:MAG TPA: NAD-dependent epimerase/dehydratase family protein [Acidimicrobiales bacterium]|nr:NAD-dependent epimerase/dehydratase family protein [Acidimicrobiales bacterium]